MSEVGSTTKEEVMDCCHMVNMMSKTKFVIQYNLCDFDNGLCTSINCHNLLN